MNAYVRNKLAKRKAQNATRDEALSILEELRQEASVQGTEDLATIERNRRLINGTIDNDPVAPYREVSGASVQGLGIDGAFKPDSTVRLHTEYGKTNDPVLAPDAEDCTNCDIASHACELPIMSRQQTATTRAMTLRLRYVEDESES